MEWLAEPGGFAGKSRSDQLPDTDYFQSGLSPLSHANPQKYRNVMHLHTPSQYDAEENHLKRFKRVEKRGELASAIKRHWNSTHMHMHAVQKD